MNIAQIIAANEKLRHLKELSTKGDWMMGVDTQVYEDVNGHTVVITPRSKHINNAQARRNAEYVMTAHNTPSEMYTDMLINRIYRLETALRDVRRVLHDAAAEKYIDTFLDEGLIEPKYSKSEETR